MSRRLSPRPLALCAAAALAGGADGAAAQSASNSIVDFMIMDVCVDASDAALPNLTPFDPGCAHRRNIRAGEKIPYHLHDFPPNGSGCAKRLGSISKDNIPVERNGVTRVVSFYDAGVDHSCPDVADDAPRFGELDGGPGSREGGSVQWHDDSYGFIMGSWSPVALSHWRTPLCRENPNSSRRFQRAWVIGPNTLPPPGVPGHGVFQVKAEHGDPAGTAGSCPSSFSKSLNVWIRDQATFKNGRATEALISDHYSRDITNPKSANAMQIERTYWTKELGLSRWEKWAREDWVHPRSGKPVLELARQLYASGVCSTPYAFTRPATPALRLGAVQKPDVYAMTVEANGETHVWYMTLCRDYTNLVLDEGGGLAPKWGEAISPAYWTL